MSGAGNLSVLWLGSGAGLYLGLNADQPVGSMTRIECAGSDGTYDTRSQARAAVGRFIARGQS